MNKNILNKNLRNKNSVNNDLSFAYPMTFIATKIIKKRC